MEDNRTETNIMSNKKFYYIVAIDYGTSRTGFAWSLKDCSPNIDGIKYYQDWPDQPNVSKCETWELTDGNGKILQWGRPAGTDWKSKKKPTSVFSKLFGKNTDQKDETNPPYFHQRVKMDLFDIQSNKDMGNISDYSWNIKGEPVRTIGDQTFETIGLIAAFLSEIKKQALKELRSIEPGITEDVIRWVLTIPANSEEKQKNWMRKAAFQAGLIDSESSDSLLLALEPEMALLSVQRKQPQIKAAEKRHIKIVVDAGGGTVDVSAYEYSTDSSFKQVATSQAVNAGSTYLNKAIYDFMDGLVFPEDIIERFQEEEPKKWKQFTKEVERTKTDFGPTNTNFELRTRDIYDFYQDNTPDALQELQYINPNSGNFEMASKDFENKICFEVYDKVQKQIENVLKELRDKKNDLDITIYLVGGFSCSKSLREYLKNNIELDSYITDHNQNIVWGSEGIMTNFQRESAILEGAVLFGDDPDRWFSSRIARYTMGFKTSVKYTPVYKSRGAQKFYNEEYQDYFIKNVFYKIVKTGESVEVGKVVKRKINIESNRPSLPIELLYSDDPDLLFVDEPGVYKLGKDVFCLDFSSTIGTEKRAAIIEMTLGKPEIEVVLYDKDNPENKKKFYSPVPDNSWTVQEKE